jgi:integrase
LPALEARVVLARALEACGQKLDGSAASAEDYRRRRRVLYAVLKHAMLHGHLSANPLDGPQQAGWKAPAVARDAVRRRVPSPLQMRELLTAIGKVGRSQGPRLVALYGCMYYAMHRPSEAISLRRDDCQLRATGWGLIEFSETHSAAGRDWTDDGEVHERRAPKGGPKNAVRRVPIPPELVALRRDHIDAYGTGPDGRLFGTYIGGIYQHRRHPQAVDLMACAPGGAPAGVYLGAGGLAAGPQAVRLPACRGVLAAELRRARPEGR